MSKSQVDKYSSGILLLRILSKYSTNRNTKCKIILGYILYFILQI